MYVDRLSDSGKSAAYSKIVCGKSGVVADDGNHLAIVGHRLLQILNHSHFNILQITESAQCAVLVFKSI